MGNSYPVSSKWNVAKAFSFTQKPSYGDGKPIVLVGPVIGLVTTNSARILLEVDREANVTVTLLKESHHDLKQRGSIRRISSGLLNNLTCVSSFKQIPTDGNPECSKLHQEDSNNEKDSIHTIHEAEELQLASEETVSHHLKQQGSLRRIGSELLNNLSYVNSFKRIPTDGNPESSQLHQKASDTDKDSAPRRLQHSKSLETHRRVQDTVKCSIDMKARRPSIFQFNNLEPGTYYKVIVEECHDAVPESRFRTFPLEPADTFHIAAISCNSIFITKTDRKIRHFSDLWFHLSNLIPSKVDLIVHIGDQDLPKEEWSSKEDEICEKYRDVYRATWKHPHTAKCLATCPNIMIYDDHEIRDNWGDNDADRLTDSAEYFVASCAWSVMVEYQRQLYEDVDFNNLKTITKDHHFHVIGKVGFMFLDIRGSRTFYRVEHDQQPYLGSKQWEDIKSALDENGLFGKVEVLVVCSPAPLVFLTSAITKALSEKFSQLEDFKGHWSNHQKEQIEMINCLEQWKKSSSKRDVIVIGGDVHCGGHSKIMKNEEVLFYQLTTSAIANMPLPALAYYGVRLLEQFTNIKDNDDKIRFCHFNWTRRQNDALTNIKDNNGKIRFWHFNCTRRRNYGLVEIQLPQTESQKPEIKTQLVKGPKFPLTPNMGKAVSNLDTSTGNGKSWYQFARGRPSSSCPRVEFCVDS